MDLDVLDALDRALLHWLKHESFGHAVRETVARTGYATADVEQQLHRVVERSRGATMRQVLELELATTHRTLDDAPRRVLVLAAGRVPGLAIEAIASGLAVGARVLVRPSREETVLQHLLAVCRSHHPLVAGLIELVGIDDGPMPWSRADGAIVFGSDATIAMVRDHLDEPARDRVAGYGSRQGIAVVLPEAAADPTWAQRLADDVLTFRQQGCMSPSWLFVVGDGSDAEVLVDAAGRELVRGRQRHLAPGIDDRLQQRRSSDADILGAIAAGLAPETSALYAGDARVTVVRVADEEELDVRVRALGSLLQTAVLACGDDDRERVATMLRDAGVTRVCAPGDAHRPEPTWPQDGLGRVLPLLGAQ